MASEIEQFAESLHQQVFLEADMDGAERMRSEVFTRLLIETLMEVGEVEEAVPCYYRSRGIEVHGYGVDDGDTLNLITTIYSGDGSVATVKKSDLGKVAKRALAFVEKCLNPSRPLHLDLEESSEAYDMALHVNGVAGDIRRVRLFVLTDGVSRLDKLELDELPGIELRSGIWDIERLFRLESSGQTRESIEIDFEERFGEPLPCLVSETKDSDQFRALLAVIPGDWLAEIYDEYGARLLELNVRSFLQATGKVNRGIRDTLKDQPERFLAYNNGISSTASKVKLGKASDGQVAIKSMKDLQIVNGGQTTASVHRALMSKVDLSEVAVQMKVTVVPEQALDDVVPSISKYANSQNKVSNADLSSNDPFHVQIEELSRVTWAPAIDDSAHQSKWFYERARGQYRDALANQSTPARKRTWQAEYPKPQSFSKTDLARFHNSWDQLPHIVARGAQKNFTVFMTSLAERRLKPDPDYFHRPVAKAILWKTAYGIAGDQFPSYRPNLASYAVAKLSHGTSMRVDLDRIWESQATSEETNESLEFLTAMAWRIAVEQAPSGMNVGEWAKKEECWKLMKSEPWSIPDKLDQGLLVLGRASNGNGPSAVITDDPSVAECQALGPEAWFALSNWAKETGNLAPWQRSLAYSLGKRLNRGNPPTLRQGQQGKRVLDEAKRLGFTT
ncbi:MAG: AIPR family protein [Solirubrobacterales bacterium]|nr:AIPR family protein [Solirubrobacterales bacterium]